MHRSSGVRRYALVGAIVLVGGLIPGAAPHVVAAGPTFSILDTNDFHGQLQASGSNPGLARVAGVVDSVREEMGDDNVLLVDAGDEMQGSLLSNLQKGAPTIDAFNAMGEQIATFGNHEFDWGQTVLADRTKQAQYPFVTANIVKNDTGSCSTAGWAKPDFAKAPYEVMTVGGVKVAVIGVTTQETPTITVASATAGLCFKDPAESIEHYYAEMKGAADMIVVLSHLGLNDGGYGYGIPVYGDKTLAQKLNDAGDPVALIVGGHSHTNMMTLATPGAVTVGGTTIVQAYYNGRQVGRADVTMTGATPTINWTAIPVSTTGAEGATVKGVIDAAANDKDYQALINKPIGYAQVDLLRNYTGDSMMADFVDDAIYRALNTDSTKSNDIDMFFNNSGGIRTDWCAKADSAATGGWTWSSDPADCKSGTWTHAPMLLTYGQMFTILPFGNATVVGTMTGAQILEVLNQAATLNKGAIQVSGLRYKFYHYQKPDPKSTTTPPAMHTYAWGAYDACIVNPTTGKCDLLDLKKTYRVGTNEFLAPAGGDNFSGFKYMKNLTYWGDMLDAVNTYVAKSYTQADPYKGPAGTGKLDGRITQDGTAAGGSIVPITILHNNDSHGNLPAYEQLATLIRQERAYNPARTLLLNAGDQIQGDAASFYFKTSYTGKASDGTPLPASLKTDPIIAVMNALGYNAMTLGNHEFNFGGGVFKGVLGQANFAVLGANVKDDGSYGLAGARGGSGVKPYLTSVVGPEKISVAIVGITNHRVPSYELPSNINGLTFSNPLTVAKSLSAKLAPKDDAVVALTHIGFTTDPKSVDVDENVDTAMAAKVTGIDAIVGGHSHTSPVTAFGDYRYLPTIVANPLHEPVEVTQAYRYNQYLGEVILGMRPIVVGTIDDVSMLYGAGLITSKTVANTLTSKLNAIKASFARKQTTPAIAQLDAFIRYVVAQRTAGTVKVKAASYLINDAKSMKTHKGGYETTTESGQYLAVTKDTPADPQIKAIVDPYLEALTAYQDKVVGKTTVPIDTLKAFTEETNGADLQADAAVYELSLHGVSDVDVHLSGAMTNKKIAADATEANPVTLKVSDMFAAMPYENSLVVLKMNGPQLKAVLERAYRNFYYYTYVDGYGGYSHYTTCMLDTNAAGKVTYNEKTVSGQTVPPKPDGTNVVSFEIDGKAVNFSDATTYYNVSTVNYLAAGACNFSDNGKSLWPLNQIVHDTQYYVRDSVIDYISHEGTVSPKIEGRLVFENQPR